MEYFPPQGIKYAWLIWFDKKYVLGKYFVWFHFCRSCEVKKNLITMKVVQLSLILNPSAKRCMYYKSYNLYIETYLQPLINDLRLEMRYLSFRFHLGPY